MSTKDEAMAVKPKWTASRLLHAVLLFIKIVWRKWDRVEVEQGKWVTLRISWSTAWTVSKGIWLS